LDLVIKGNEYVVRGGSNLNLKLKTESLS